MRKYGQDNFIIECLEEVPQNQLDEKEVYYIEQYQSLAILGKGYNVLLGGKGYHTIDYLLVNKLWAEGKSIHEISIETGANRYGIRHVLMSNPTYTEEEARKRGNTYQRQTRLKKVYQYSAAGEFIAEYSDAAAAAKTFSATPKNIWVALTTPGSLAHGYQWSYYLVDKIMPVEHTPRRYKAAISEITDNGDVIATYESAKAAALATGLRAEAIRAACKKADNRYLTQNRFFKYSE
jgi:hypothetical protein